MNTYSSTAPNPLFIFFLPSNIGPSFIIGAEESRWVGESRPAEERIGTSRADISAESRRGTSELLLIF